MLSVTFFTVMHNVIILIVILLSAVAPWGMTVTTYCAKPVATIVKRIIRLVPFKASEWTGGWWVRNKD
jgi:hypothetical protein